MTTLRVAEGSNGIPYTFTVFQIGSNTAEDLSAYTTATMAVTSLDFQTVHNADITLAFVSKPNGTVRYTSASATDNLPSVPAKKEEIRLKGKVKFTATGVKELSRLIDIVVEKNISGT